MKSALLSLLAISLILPVSAFAKESICHLVEGDGPNSVAYLEYKRSSIIKSIALATDIQSADTFFECKKWVDESYLCSNPYYDQEFRAVLKGNKLFILSEKVQQFSCE